jgi:ABC-type sugar transport system ATPase subunit
MIHVEQLTVRAGAFALQDISFSIPRGQYGVLMGRTGAGKTTLLEAICGLKPVAGGAIRLNGADVTRLHPAHRGIGYVPQDRALFSTQTVREQLGFALEVRKLDAAAIAARVAELAQLLAITPLLDRRPYGLSGGEAQRVAVGRALAARPAILCLDEPLNGLDDETRREMQALLRTVQQTTGVTTLHVTHNLEEAQHLADKVFLLRDGRVQEAPVAKLQAPSTKIQ